MLCGELQEDRKHNILDLGDARGPNVEFLGRFPCRIFVEAFFESLSEHEGSDDDESAIDVATLLTHPRDVKLDVILGWDLFDYLDGDVIDGLMSHISKHCRPGTLLYMLTSTRSDIPAIPAKFTIMEDNFVFYEPTTVEVITNPGRTALAVEKMMTGFRLLHSFMLRNGMQEYVFVST